MITDDMNVATVISPITENVIIVKDFVGSAYLVDWEFNGIGEFLVGQGYQIKTNDEVSLELCRNLRLPRGSSYNTYSRMEHDRLFERGATKHFRGIL